MDRALSLDPAEAAGQAVKAYIRMNRARLAADGELFAMLLPARFAEAEKIAAPFRDEAILGKARCNLETQELKGALESYRQYLASYPSGERAGEISLRVQELEAKVAASGGK